MPPRGRKKVADDEKAPMKPTSTRTTRHTRASASRSATANRVNTADKGTSTNTSTRASSRTGTSTTPTVNKPATTKTAAKASTACNKPLNKAGSTAAASSITAKPVTALDSISDYDYSDYYSSDDYDDDDDDDEYADFCDYGGYGDFDCVYDYDPFHYIRMRRFSDFHRCAFDSDDDMDDYSDDYDFDGFDGFDYSDDSSSEVDMNDFTGPNAALAAEAYLRGYSAFPLIPAETRARISDFILFLHTLPNEQVTTAFTNFRNDLNDNLFPINNSSSNGLTDAEIDRLPRHIHRGPTQKEIRLREDPHKCCICMADLETGESLILLEKCSHRFHAECLKSWLRRSKQCPICRATILPPPLVINLID